AFGNELPEPTTASHTAFVTCRVLRVAKSRDSNCGDHWPFGFTSGSMSVPPGRCMAVWKTQRLYSSGEPPDHGRPTGFGGLQPFGGRTRMSGLACHERSGLGTGRSGSTSDTGDARRVSYA